MARTLAKIIIGILSLWALGFIIAEIMGVTIYFPFTIVEKQEIPYHRITSVRLAVFLTFAYFGFRYIFFQTEKLYPIQFLDIYLKSLTISGLFVFYSMKVFYSIEASRYFMKTPRHSTIASLRSIDFFGIP